MADGIEVLLVSTPMLASALRVRELSDLLHGAGSRPKLVVGGAPFLFDERLWREVGADAMGRCATDAPIEVEAMGGEVIFVEDGPPNAGRPLVAHLLREREHLLSPGRLEHWREYAHGWGLDQATAGQLFGETTSRLIGEGAGLIGISCAVLGRKFPARGRRRRPRDRRCSFAKDVRAPCRTPSARGCAC